MQLEKLDTLTSRLNYFLNDVRNGADGKNRVSVRRSEKSPKKPQHP